MLHHNYLPRWHLVSVSIVSLYTNTYPENGNENGSTAIIAIWLTCYLVFWILKSQNLEYHNFKCIRLKKCKLKLTLSCWILRSTILSLLYFVPGQTHWLILRQESPQKTAVCSRINFIYLVIFQKRSMYAATENSQKCEKGTCNRSNKKPKFSLVNKDNFYRTEYWH